MQIDIRNDLCHLVTAVYTGVADTDSAHSKLNSSIQRLLTLI